LTVCTIEAPCKINLHLRVLDRLPGGFHNLESLFLSLAFGDSLRFSLAGDGGDCEICQEGGKSSPRERNLVYRSFLLFRARTGFRKGIKVILAKRTPSGAGLGGGSSDAASTLLALDKLAGTALSEKVLGEMARELGSDVPSFLSGGAALVEGRGEKIEPLKTPEGFWVVLVKPSFPSPTAEAFRLLDRCRERGLEFSPCPPLSRAELRESLGKDPGLWSFSNDFLTVFLEGDPENEGAAEVYRDILEGLKGRGASFSGLSGSGSCCFGIFTDGGRAEKGVKFFAEKGFFSTLTFPLARRARAV
jgi:4-diphosphocytidyl-2-C-methyl-D-erythritol kinase